MERWWHDIREEVFRRLSFGVSSYGHLRHWIVRCIRYLSTGTERLLEGLLHKMELLLAPLLTSLSGLRRGSEIGIHVGTVVVTVETHGHWEARQQDSSRELYILLLQYYGSTKREVCDGVWWCCEERLDVEIDGTCTKKRKKRETARPMLR
jgi:hypothetical protein